MYNHTLGTARVCNFCNCETKNWICACINHATMLHKYKFLRIGKSCWYSSNYAHTSANFKMLITLTLLLSQFSLMMLFNGLLTMHHNIMGGLCKYSHKVFFPTPLPTHFFLSLKLLMWPSKKLAKLYLAKLYIVPSLAICKHWSWALY